MAQELLKSLRISLLSVIVLALACSCSGSSAPDPEDGNGDQAKEIKAKSKTSLDLPELELFSNAKRQYEAGLYSVARESFTAIKENYPTGPFAEYADIKIADSLFENSDYQAAAVAYEDFTKNRPASTSMPYALLRAARSYEQNSSGEGRDPTPLEKALEIYNSLIERYPDSVYSASARYYKAGVVKLLATYEQTVISFYQNQEKDEATRLREAEFLKRYGVSSSEFTKGDYDKKAGLELLPVAESELEAAKAKLKQLPPINNNRSFTSSEQANVLAQNKLASGKFQISSLSCDQAQKLVILIINPKPVTNLSALKTEKKGDSFELRIDELTTIDEETKAYSCFSEGDLTVSSSGLITLKYEATAIDALYVDNPSRIILTIK